MDSNASWTPAGSGDRSPEEERQLSALFDGLRPREDELPRLDELRRAVEARVARPKAENPGIQGKGWLEMWNPAHWSALRLAGAVSLLLLVLACTVPLNYDRDAGLSLNLRISGDLEPVLNVLRDGPWSVENLSIEEEGEESRVQALLRDASPEELAALEGLAGVVMMRVEPWEETSRGSLVSMMMDNVFNVQMNISGMSDDEINRTLNERLQAEGYPGRVSIVRPEGASEIVVQVVGDSTSPGPLTIELTDGDQEGSGALGQAARALNLRSEEMRGLSEAEIRARVVKQLLDSGVNLDSSRLGIKMMTCAPGSPGGCQLDSAGMKFNFIRDGRQP
jgi:hypothetical protein